MTRIVLNPGETIEVCFTALDGLMLKRDSVVIAHVNTTMTAEAHIEKHHSGGRITRIGEVEIEE